MKCEAIEFDLLIRKTEIENIKKLMTIKQLSSLYHKESISQASVGFVWK